MKQHKVIVLLDVKQDIKEAFNWYNRVQPGLGKRLINDLTFTLKSIEQNPTSFAIRYRNYRLANLKVFPYAAHFSIDVPNDTVFITAFLHSSRNYSLE